MTPKNKEIGDPLASVVATGKIGHSSSQKSNSPDVQNSSYEHKSKKSRLPEVSKRVQQTIYLPSDLAKWVKKQAIEEEREISEIATEALDNYRKLHQ